MTTAPRLSKRQSLSTTTVTVLFRTTFTRTIKLNLLLDLFKLVISFVLGSFKWTAEMKSHLPLNLVFQYINFTVNLRIYFSVFLLFFFHKHIWLHLNSHKTSAPQISLFFVFFIFFLEFYLLINFYYLCFFYLEYLSYQKETTLFHWALPFLKI